MGSTICILDGVPCSTTPPSPANANACDEAALAAAYARGRAAFPHLDLPPEAFVRHLASIGGGPRTLPVLADRAVEDLFLACACLQGVDGAVATFHRRFGPIIGIAVRSLAGNAATQSEMRQDFLEDLLVGTAGHPPLIARYRGEGPLAAWLAVAAHRRGISRLRAEQAEGRARVGAAAQSAPELSPEHIYCQRRYRAAFERAIADATLSLTPHARQVLGLYWVRCLGLKEIGARHGVTKSTASRWVADASRTLVGQTRHLLRQRLGITEDDLMALADELSGHIDVSLSRLLATGDDAAATAMAHVARGDLAQSGPESKLSHLNRPAAAPGDASWSACAASAA